MKKISGVWEFLEIIMEDKFIVKNVEFLKLFFKRFKYLSCILKGKVIVGVWVSWGYLSLFIFVFLNLLFIRWYGL